jgi:C4-dicarboxylate transporter, DctM subunit
MSERPATTGVLRRLASVEHGFSIAILASMIGLTLFGVLARWITGESLAGLTRIVQSLNLWIAFAGAALAAGAGKHLALSTGALLDLTDRVKQVVRRFTTAVATAVTVLLAYASYEFVQAMTSSAETLAGGIPVWVVQCIMPVGFGVVAIRLAWTGTRSLSGRLISVVAVALACSLFLVPEGQRAPFNWLVTAIILGAVVLGAPIYTAIGGLAMLFFWGKALPVPISAVPLETYDITTEPMLVTIPLFTLAGYLLAEGGASRRLVQLFRAWFGWIPGGTAAAAVMVCAFFTTFTGASGVTILALGGLLLPILLKAGYPDRFAVGLLAASGSIGLLFPPSLPVILYGSVSHVPIDDLYLAGIIPGSLLIGLLVIYGFIVGIRNGIGREPLVPGDALRALWEAKLEVLLPVLVLVFYFGGMMTIFEAAAFTAAYAFVSEVFIHRDLHWRRDVPRVVVECVTLIGGVLIILGVAKGFTNYLVDAEVPMKMTEWVAAHVDSKLLFILLLNLFLLIVGCLMDIFSAIVVVVPLIVPIGLAFGVDPVHLGILFLANLELGFLTPPVGMNLFLASYRFERPLTQIYRMALPFLGILAVGVLLIAYLPAMTTWVSDDEAEAIDWENVEPADGPGESRTLDLPDNIDLMQELLAGDDDDATPASKPLVIPDGVDLMQELMAGDDDSGSGP